MPDNVYEIKLTDTTPGGQSSGAAPGAPAPDWRREFAQDTFRRGIEEIQKQKEVEHRLQLRESQFAQDTWRKGIEIQKKRREEEEAEAEKQRRLTGAQRTGVGRFFQGIGQRSEGLDEWRAANGTMLRGVGTFTSTLAAAGTLVTEAFRLAAFRINKSTEIATKYIGNDVQGAELAKIEKEKGTVGSVAGASGAVIGGTIGSFIAPGIGTAIGAALGSQVGKLSDAIYDLKAARKTEFIDIRDKFRTQGYALSSYNPSLAQAFTYSEVGKQRRDIGEAAIIGGRLADIEFRQKNLDTLEQQISILNKIKESDEQRARVNREIRDKSKQLEELLKNVDKNTADAVRKLSEIGESPVDGLKKAGGFRTGSARAGGGVDMAREPLRIPAVEDQIGRSPLKRG